MMNLPDETDVHAKEDEQLEFEVDSIHRSPKSTTTFNVSDFESELDLDRDGSFLGDNDPEISEKRAMNMIQILNLV